MCKSPALTCSIVYVDILGPTAHTLLTGSASFEIIWTCFLLRVFVPIVMGINACGVFCVCVYFMFANVSLQIFHI